MAKHKKAPKLILNRYSAEVQKLILDELSLDETGKLVKTDNIYINLKVRICYRDNNIDIPLSHLIWFIKNKIWPKKGKHIDHKDHNALNNHPDNLQELTPKENNNRMKGRTRRRYGHYGYSGISVDQSSKGRYYARQYIRVEGRKEKVKITLFSAFTREELEIKIKNYVENPPTIDDIFE